MLKNNALQGYNIEFCIDLEFLVFNQVSNTNPFSTEVTDELLRLTHI